MTYFNVKLSVTEKLNSKPPAFVVYDTVLGYLTYV